MLGYRRKPIALTLGSTAPIAASSQRSGAAVNERRAAPPVDDRIFGTWDFKWPQGTKIRVAFRRLPDAYEQALANLTPADDLKLCPDEREKVDKTSGFSRLTQIVECLANRWLKAVPEKGAPSIRFEFVHPPQDERYEVTAIGDKITASNYDVLVSFDPLPLFHVQPSARSTGAASVTRNRPKTSDAYKIFLPGSELGRYARRPDLGVPTTYLGMREHFPAPKDTPPDSTEFYRFSKYFESPEFYHWTIHEFGHVLGMPHEHQNPNASSRINLKPVPAMTQILREALNYASEDPQDITEAEIEEEIFREWPVRRDSDGNIQYSDFRSYGSNDVVDDKSSVMLHVFWNRLLLNGAADSPPLYHVSPTERDLEHLAAMYPPV